MQSDLFTVIIICYRHFEFLYEAIDSVLRQDYPSIELLVADDGSDGFPESEIRRYIDEHKGSNIVNVVIQQEEQNCGTVRHINHALDYASGQYIALLAGDDILYNCKVLSNYVKGFSRADKDCLVEMAQVAMCDYTLENIESYYLSEEVRRAIEESAQSTEKLKKCLIKYGACLPSTSTCFKKAFFSSVGKFDESYYLMEDYPMHVRLAFEGIPIHYENMVAVKHRTGGISHGQADTLSASAVKYWKDTRRAYAEIQLKHLDILDAADRNLAETKLRKSILWIDLLLTKSDKHIFRMLFSLLKSPGCAVDLGLQSIQQPVRTYTHKLVVCACMINVSIPFLHRFCIGCIGNNRVSDIVSKGIGIIGIISVLVAVVFWVLLIFVKIIDRISEAPVCV